jgi:RNase H-like domain found in reverse transcriptase
MKPMKLAFPDPDKRICVLTDASDRFYAGLMTKIDMEQLDLTMEEQDNQPLAFLSGEFKYPQLRWTVPEKEDFAIVDTVTEVDYLLLSHDEFSILTILTSHTFTILSRQTQLWRAMRYTSCNAGLSIFPCSFTSWST